MATKVHPRGRPVEKSMLAQIPKTPENVARLRLRRRFAFSTL